MKNYGDTSRRQLSPRGPWAPCGLWEPVSTPL